MSDITPNTIESYLKHCIDKYYSKLLTKYNFELVYKQIGEIGALYQYQNENFRFTITNDRGLVDSTLAPVHDLSVVFELAYLYSLISLKQNPELSQWDKRMVLKKSLSCEEEEIFIDSNYALLVDLLSRKNYQNTKAESDELGRERDRFLFGRPM